MKNLKIYFYNNDVNVQFTLTEKNHHFITSSLLFYIPDCQSFFGIFFTILTLKPLALNEYWFLLEDQFVVFLPKKWYLKQLIFTCGRRPTGHRVIQIVVVVVVGETSFIHGHWESPCMVLTKHISYFIVFYFLRNMLKSFESRLTIFLSYSFIQRARTRARSF